MVCFYSWIHGISEWPPESHPHQETWGRVWLHLWLPANIAAPGCHNRMVTCWMERCKWRMGSFFHGKGYRNLGRWLQKAEGNRTYSQVGIWLLGPQFPMRDMPLQQSEDSTKCKNFACDICKEYYTLTPTHARLFWRLCPKACSPCRCGMACVGRLVSSSSETALIRHCDSETRVLASSPTFLLPSWFGLSRYSSVFGTFPTLHSYFSN